MPIGRSPESAREPPTRVDDVELRLNESDLQPAPVVDSSVASAYTQRQSHRPSASTTSSPHAHQQHRQTDHLAPMKAAAGHVM